MNRGSRIVAIDTDGQPETGALAADAVLETAGEQADEPAWDAEDGDAAPAAPRALRWIVPALALAALAGWTGFFAWTQRGIDPYAITGQQAVALLVSWCQPTLLICVLWLLATRNSTREAARFSQVALQLSHESERLESRLRSMNSELSLAREFITSQGRDLEALGRIAAERLSHNAGELQALIRDNGAQVDAIGAVSTAALANMEALRGHLPVIASSAKDITNNIATAGRAANSQVQEMIQAFKRINEFGQASEKQVVNLRGQVDQALTLFTARADAFDALANQRFAALSERSEEFRTALDRHEIEALAAIRSRATALADELAEARGRVGAVEEEGLAALRQRLEAVRDEGSGLTETLRAAEESTLAAWQAQLERMRGDMTELLATLEETDGNVMKAARQRMIALSQEAARLDESMAKRNAVFDDLMSQRRSAAEQAEGAAMAKLSGSLDDLDAELAARAARQTELAETLAAQAGQVAAQVAELEARIAEVSELGGSAGAQLADKMGALFERLANSQHALTETDSAMATLTDSSVRLLEIIQAGVQHSREDLPAAIASGEGRLSDMERRIITLRDTVDEANRHGESLSAYVLASGAELGRAGSQLEDLHASLAERSASQEAALTRIGGLLASLGDESRSLADHAQGELSAAIAQLSSAAQDAVSGIENLSAATIGGIAARLGEESGAAIESAMRARTAELAGQVEQAVAHAAGAGREATIQLRDQLAKVNELASNLERRIAHARERAEDQLDNDFARRVALITDSLNSHAIDISKAMSADVADTAWAAYLRGDRGVFTRRAVSLIDGGEARSILQAYENDNDFRDHVSRYIHDFEAMLRQLLSTRDGHALGVTLLSSDMGKLYVALAQAIERLRA